MLYFFIYLYLLAYTFLYKYMSYMFVQKHKNEGRGQFLPSRTHFLYDIWKCAYNLKLIIWSATASKERFIWISVHI